jgi:hypothetical protein
MGPKRSRPRHFTHSKAKPTRRKRKSVTSKSSQTAKQPYVSPTQAVREMRDGAPATALRAIRSHLELANSTAIIVGYALKGGQHNGLEGDAADVLRRYVSDKLFGQIVQINLLLGEDEGDDVEEGEDKNLGVS